MINVRFLNAVGFLHEVGTPILRQRDGVRQLLATADDLRQRAALVQQQAEQAQRILERRVLDIWSKAEVEAAQQRAGGPR